MTFADVQCGSETRLRFVSVFRPLNRSSSSLDEFINRAVVQVWSSFEGHCLVSLFTCLSTPLWIASRLPLERAERVLSRMAFSANMRNERPRCAQSRGRALAGASGVLHYRRGNTATSRLKRSHPEKLNGTKGHAGYRDFLEAASCAKASASSLRGSPL